MAAMRGSGRGNFIAGLPQETKESKSVEGCVPRHVPLFLLHILCNGTMPTP